jgi:hypothetical protein
MRIVNGYACANCSDVSLAKRGVDPQRPGTDPLKPANAARARERDPFGEAVAIDGRLAGSVDPARRLDRQIGVNIDIRA